VDKEIFMNTNNRHRLKLRLTAFTLSEVLITLAIISVIASMTIPSLLNNLQKQEQRSTFMKTFSVISQATLKIMMDNEGSMMNVCVGFPDNCMVNTYANHLKVIKKCENNKSNGNCWHNNDGSSKYLNGESVTTWIDRVGLVLNDGSFFRAYKTSNTCEDNTYSTKGDCGYIEIDINGFNKPNRLGRDIFFFHIQPDGIVPWGVSDDDSNINGSSSSNCISTGSGRGCAAVILQGKNY